MKTIIEISGLRLWGRHGVMEQERRVGNEFVFDLKLDYPFEMGAVRDDLDGTLNYAVAIEVIKKVNSEPSALIENVAWRLKESLMLSFPAISGGMIRVAKIKPPVRATAIDSVAVVIRW